MADLVLPVDLGSIEGPNCYENRNADAAKVAAAMTVTIPGQYASWVFSQTEPAVEDRDKAWGKLDSSGNPLQAFYWSISEGEWLPFVEADIYWAELGGAVNAYTATVPTFAYFDLTARNFTLFFKAYVTNTGASTLTFNSFAAKALTVAGNALWAGALIEDQWYAAVWDGTNFEVTSISELDVADIPPGELGEVLKTGTGPITGWDRFTFATSSSSIPAESTKLEVAHSLNTVPSGVFWKLKCIDTDNGFPVDYQLDISCVRGDGDGTDDFQAFTWGATDAVVHLSRTSAVYGALVVIPYAGGARAALAEIKWVVFCEYAR